jgi:hypothetical protein
MAYRRPAIEVIQEFQQAAAALALPALPACVIGPGFQIVDNADAGPYLQTTVGATSFPYPGLAGAGIVDLGDIPDTTEDANAFKPVGVALKNAYLVKVGQLTTGQLTTPNLFDDNTGLPFDTFDPEAAGAPTFYVEVISGSGVVDADIGRKLVIGKNTDNELVVAANWQSGSLPKTGVTYRILEFRESEVYPPSSFADNNIEPDADAVVIQPGLQTVTDTVPLDVVEADVLLSWRALRPDLANALTAFTDLASLEAVFGVGSVVPANVAPYVINLALSNTTTAVSYTGLNAEFFDEEENSYQAALEFLENKDVYGLAILTSNPAIHQQLSSHVSGMSDPTVGRERVGFMNRKLVTTAVVVPPSGLGTVTSAGSGNGTGGTTNKTFKDPTNGLFITDGVSSGQFLEIVSYTALPGVNRHVTPAERDYLDNVHSLIQIENAAFTGADVGRFIIVSLATSTTNDLAFQITSNASTVKADTSPAPAVGEVFPVGARTRICTLNRAITHDAADAVVAGTKNWHFTNGAFTGGDVGRILFTAGTSNSGNKGAFTIASVIDGTHVTSVESPGADETFGGGVTQSIYNVIREPARDIAADNVVGSTRVWTIHNANFTADDVGRILRVAGATNSGNNADHVIDAIIGSNQVHTTSATTPVTEEFNGLTTTTLTTLDIVSETTNDTEDNYILNTRHPINSVSSESILVLQVDPTDGYGGTLDDVEYRITRDLSRDDQAEFLAGYATSFANRRLVSMWPDILAVSVNSVVTEVPGYFAGGVLAGMTAGLPSQAGFTNLSVVGFIGRANSDDVFSDTQLDVIAGGGNLIFVQPVPDAALLIRHQLTTDVSTIFFQEFSVTKNVDLITRFFRNLYRPFIGIYNITDGLFDLLKTRGEGGVQFLMAQQAPRVGPPLLSGRLTRVAESDDAPDTVEIDIGISVPLPLNNLIITLLI